MNIGITIGDKTLYIAALNDIADKPEFYKTSIDLRLADVNMANGHIWDNIDEDINKVFSSAEKIALTIPARICYSKIISMDLDKKPDSYLKWLAGIQIPGDLEKYIYGFIPLNNNDRSGNNNVLIYATPSELFWPLFCAAVKDDVYDKVELVPEYTALNGLLTESNGGDGSRQTGIVNIGQSGAAVVVKRNSKLSAVRFFPFEPNISGDFMDGIETYLLSQCHDEDNIRVIIINRAEMAQATQNSSLSLEYKKIDAEFMSALGAIKYLLNGGKCELPEVG